MEHRRLFAGVIKSNKLNLNMKHLKNFSFFSKSLLVYNFVIILFFSAFFLDIWSVVYEPYFDTFLFLEVFVVLTTVTLYFYWMTQFSKNISQFSKFLPTLGLISLFLFAVGQHASANQIHVFVEHPTVLFYDEYLSHRLLIPALALIGGSFVRLELLYTKPSEKSMSTFEQIALGFSGIIQGIIIGIYTIEGRSSWIAGILSALVLVFIYKWLRRRKLAKFPLSLYYSTAYITVIVTLFIWFLTHGGFFEPSVSGFGRF